MRTTLLTLLLLLTIWPTQAHTVTHVRLTSYAAQEDGNSLNCQGKRLKSGMCAVDLRIYRLGTRFRLPDGTILVAADCGSAVKGAKHIDIFRRSIRDVNRYGTQFLDVEVIAPDTEVLAPTVTSRVASKSYERNPNISRHPGTTFCSCSSKHPGTCSYHARSSDRADHDSGTVRLADGT